MNERNSSSIGGTFLKIGLGALLGVTAVGMARSLAERSAARGPTGWPERLPENTARLPRLEPSVGKLLDRMVYPRSSPREWPLLMSRLGYRFYDEGTVSAMARIQPPSERSSDLYFVRPSEMGITEPAPWSAIHALLRMHGYERCVPADGPAYLLQIEGSQWNDGATFVMVVGQAEPIIMMCRQAVFGIKLLSDLGGLLAPDLPLIVRRLHS